MKSTSAANGLGDRLRRARKKAGLSQGALAREASVSASAVSQWESPGGTKPNLERLCSIAMATRVSLDWLLTGKGSASHKPTGGDASKTETPAVSLDAFAFNVIEENLLETFRTISPRARELFLQLMNEMAPESGRRARQRN
jgi:transcriptional regulator with XRE-family HTH domain